MSETGPEGEAASAASLGHLPAPADGSGTGARHGEFAYFYRTCLRRLVAFLMWQGPRPRWPRTWPRTPW
ncbi:hypothetical protein [Kitasatospora purpeofusca]|uniref:hypothetical protein n=1 Tax=Kitasatospora purpeofusca TaxID=67352 RepID=UPI003662F2D5